MQPAAAAVDVEPRRVLAEARDHARGGDEGDVAGRSQSRGSSRGGGDRLEAAVGDDAELAVAAVVDPDAPACRRAECGRVSPRAIGSRVAPGEDDAAPIDRKVAVARAAAPRASAEAEKKEEARSCRRRSS